MIPDMFKARVLLAAFMLAIAGIASAAQNAGQGSAQLAPDELVKKVVNDVLTDLDANRAEYRKDASKVRQVVDKYMLPHFDTRYAAQYVMGKYWRDATEAQRKRFIDAFYQTLLQNYGETLIDFTPDRLEILPYKGKPGDKIATVRSIVRRDNGSRVPVNYSLRLTNDGWKAYDVQIEGVSYIKSFRTDFGAEMQQKGIEATVQRLESQVASGTVKKPTAESASKPPAA